MPKIEIEVDQILTCAVVIEAEVGDRLIVMNGVVIGVVERRSVRKSAQPLDTAPIPDERTIIDMLKTSGSLKSRDISDRLSIPSKSRGHVTHLLRRMVNRGIIEPTSDSRIPPFRYIERP